MNIATLIQILNRPWLMEESQAAHYGSIAQKVLFEGANFSALVPGRNVLDWRKDGRVTNQSTYREFYRVNSSGQMQDDGELLVIDVSGPVMKNDYCGAPGMVAISQAVMAADADNTISSIMLKVNSPGGTVDGTHDLARIVAASRKMGVAYADGYMCSAAYWISSGAKEIIASDANNGYNATIGSIGTMMSWADYSAAYEKSGIKLQTVYASKSKRKGAMAAEMKEGNYTRLVSILDALNDTFHASIKATRGEKLNTDLDDVFEGDVYDARQAKKLGLIDKIGTWDYAVKRSLQLSKTIRK